MGCLPPRLSAGHLSIPLLSDDSALWARWPQFGEPSSSFGRLLQAGIHRGHRMDLAASDLSKEHFDLLATMSGLLIFRRGGNRSGDIASVFVNITRHLAHWYVRADVVIIINLPGEVRT
jgi:hypothetical protein